MKENLLSAYQGCERRVAAFYGLPGIPKSTEDWQSILLFFVPRPKSSNDPDISLRADYGDFLILRGVLSLPEAKKALERIIDGNPFVLPDGPQIRLAANLYPNLVSRRGSQYRRFPIQAPIHEYSFSVQDGGPRPAPPQGYVFGLALPLFPNAYAAIEGLLGIRVINQGTSEFIVLAPDYRASISKLRLSSADATIQISSVKMKQVLLARRITKTRTADIINSTCLSSRGAQVFLSRDIRET